MIRTVMILLLVSLLGWGAGHALRSEVMAGEQPASAGHLAHDAIQQRLHSDVVLYTLADCDYSKKAKAFFDARGIAYAELDVGESLDAREEAKSLGAVKVPFMLVGDARIEGFDESRLMKAIGEEPLIVLGAEGDS